MNAASRLESLNKEFGSKILISESVKSQLSIQVEMRDMGEVQIRGKEKRIRVFQVEQLGRLALAHSSSHG